MPTPILATKLYIPPPRPKVVLRPRLIEQLNEGLQLNQGFGRKLTLLSASAGFGKTTLLSEWVAGCEQRDPKVHVAWLSLDEADNAPARFLTYLVAALQTIDAAIGKGMLGLLQSPQPPPTESILTALLNDIAAIPDHFLLVLDDYHVIDSRPVDQALTFLLEHLPPQVHLVIATREDPHLPLARLRARGQLAELRAADLRFTPSEAAEFLNQVMGLNLSAEDIAALEARTEGWIAGLQLAALALQGTISMQGHKDAASFIQSFTGSHHFVLDYLIEEVLQQQSESVQAFLLRTSILDRMCGPLCDALLETGGSRLEIADLNPGRDIKFRAVESPISNLQYQVSSQEMLDYLEHANLFIVPLDNERHWYRYHHLFAELLRQRLQQRGSIDEYHIRASEWFESNGLTFEAFRHATAAGDVERAERLIESEGIGLHFRSVAMAVLDWLASLPEIVLDAHPLLRVRSATLALMAGQTTGVEEKLQAAEKALQNTGLDDKVRDLIGQIACARATLAFTRYDPETMVIQARRALEYLPPDNLTFLFTANWALASALMYQGNRTASARAYQEGIAISKKSGHIFSKILATASLGHLQELDNQLYLAAETYHSILPLYGEHPQPNAVVVYLGLARICYEWNDLDAAEQYGQQSLQLARQFDRVIDRFIVSEVFLARLKLARGDVDGAAAMLAEAEQSARQKSFTLRLPDIADAQVPVLIRQGQVAAAAQLARQYELPLSQARVLIAQDDPSAALAVLEPLRRQMEARGWADERLKTMVLQAVAQHLRGEKEKAAHMLGEALALAEPGGLIRLFVDEGAPMAELLSAAAAQGIRPDYANKLLAVFEVEPKDERPTSSVPGPSSLVEPLSPRELEVLRLIAQGLSNQEIGERLFLALDTVKGHNRRIFDKLQVQRRTEAIARASELGLL